MTMIRNLHKTCLVLAVTAALGAAGAAQAAHSVSINPQPAVSHATALSRGDMLRGALPLSHPVHVAVVLNLRNEAQLQAFNARPHKPMSQSQLAANHLPTQAQAQAVANFLKASGFTDVKVSANRMIVNATGPAAVASRAFNTSFAQVRTHDGRIAYANTTDAHVPNALRGIVRSVLGLQTVHKAQFYAVKAATTGGIGGHNPLEFADIYGASGLNPATSVDVAVWGWGAMDQTITDLNTYTSNNGLDPVTTNVVCVDYNGIDFDTGAGLGGFSTTDPTCNTYDMGSVEWDMDSQTIVAMSGGVKSLTFFSSSPGGYNTTVADTLNEIITPTQGEPLAQVINASFGECERAQDANQGGDGSAQAEDELFQLGIAQGQTFVVSTGDYGADECGDGGLDSASYPASSPYVVAVAGTTLNASATTYSRETEWIGSGGSPSSFEFAPDWQTDLTYGTYAGARGPDVAFDANPNTGAIYYNYGELVQVGGTSLSAPIFTGAWARLIANGAVDPMTAAGSQLYAMPTSFFHDITGGNNRGYITRRGWDWASGRGSLDLSNFSAGGTE
jgi:subtilase family serine protease